MLTQFCQPIWLDRVRLGDAQGAIVVKRDSDLAHRDNAGLTGDNPMSTSDQPMHPSGSGNGGSGNPADTDDATSRSGDGDSSRRNRIVGDRTVPSSGDDKTKLNGKSTATGDSTSASSDSDVDVAGTQEQLKQVLFADADRQTAEFFATHGHCTGPDTRTCKSQSCLLSDRGCIAYSADEQHEIDQQARGMLYKVAITGKCHPGDGAFCNRLGYCDHFDVRAGDKCGFLSENEYPKLISLLRPQPDGSFDFVSDQDSDDQQKKPAHVQLVTRALSSNDNDDARATGSKADSLTQQQVFQTAHEIAVELVTQSSATDGICHHESATCQNSTCKLGTSGCSALTPEEKDEFEQNITELMIELLSTGTCRRGSEGCDESGRCAMWNKRGERIRSCREPTMEQMEQMMDQMFASDGEQTSSQSEDRSGSAESGEQTSDAKRTQATDESTSSHANRIVKRSDVQMLVKRINPLFQQGGHGPVMPSSPPFDDTPDQQRSDDYLTVPVSSLEYDVPAPTRRQVREFMKLCKQLSENPDQLEEIAFAADVHDQTSIQKLRERFAFLATNKRQAILALKQAKLAQMLGESKQTNHKADDDLSGGLAAATTAATAADHKHDNVQNAPTN